MESQHDIPQKVRITPRLIEEWEHEAKVLIDANSQAAEVMTHLLKQHCPPRQARQIVKRATATVRRQHRLYGLFALAGGSALALAGWWLSGAPTSLSMLNLKGTGNEVLVLGIFTGIAITLIGTWKLLTGSAVDILNTLLSPFSDNPLNREDVLSERAQNDSADPELELEPPKLRPHFEPCRSEPDDNPAEGAQTDAPNKSIITPQRIKQWEHDAKVLLDANCPATEVIAFLRDHGCPQLRAERIVSRVLPPVSIKHRTIGIITLAGGGGMTLVCGWLLHSLTTLGLHFGYINLSLIAGILFGVMMASLGLWKLLSGSAVEVETTLLGSADSELDRAR